MIFSYNFRCYFDLGPVALYTNGEAGERLGAGELFGNATQQLRLLGDPINPRALHGRQCTSTACAIVSALRGVRDAVEVS